MDELVGRQVERLNASPAMAVLAITGGGARALTWLLSVPGASRTILDVQVPYSTSALSEFLGSAPDRVLSGETSRDMARAAYDRAVRLRRGGGPVIGVGCTAAIATDRPKEGEHRCFASAWTKRELRTYGITFIKGLRARFAEDEIVSKLVLRALAEASDVGFNVPMGCDPRETVEVATSEHGDPVREFFDGRAKTVTMYPDGRAVADERLEGGVLPGSFDPIHHGHEALASVAAQLLEVPVTYELSIVNVDKPPLVEAAVRRRLARLAGRRAVVVTRAPTFYDKARLFPGCTFVIGWDTAVRLVTSRYYGGGVSKMLEALSEIRRTRSRFLVAGRVHDGVFRTLEDVPVPPGFDEMFTAVPESVFRCDLSSTELRLAR